MPTKHPLVALCSDGRLSLPQLESLYEADREITFRTFARHVCIGELSDYLGYAYGRHVRGLRLGNDYCVRFYRSKLNEKPCYHMDWSAIDHVFQAQHAN